MFQRTGRQVKFEVQIANSQQETDRLIADVQRAKKALEDVNAAGARAAAVGASASEVFDRVSQDVGLAGDVESNLNAVRGLIEKLGGTELSQGLMVFSDAATTVKALPKLRAAVAGLPEVLDAAAAAVGTTRTGFLFSIAAVGAAITALSFAVSAVVQTIQQGTERLQQAVAAQTDLYQFLQTATSESIRARIDEEQAGLEATRRILAQLEEQRQALIGAGTDIFGNLLNSVAVNALTEEIRKLQAETGRAEGQIAQLQGALSSAQTAANDAAQALEREVNLRLTLRSATEQELTERLLASSEEIAIRAELNALTVEQTRAFTEEYRIIQQLLPAARERSRQLEREAEVMRRAAAVTANRNALLSRLAQLEKVIASTREKVTNAERDYQKALDDARKIQDRATEQLQEAEQERRDALLRAEESASDALLRLARNTARNRQKIERDFAAAASNAIATRDALAFTLAQRARERQLTELEEGYGDQEREIRESLARQQRDIQQAYVRRQQLIMNRLTQDIAAAREEINQRRFALQTARNELQTSLNQEAQLRSLFYRFFGDQLRAALTESLNNAFQWRQALVQLFRPPTAPNAPPRPATPGGGIGPFLPTLPGVGRQDNTRTVNINVQGATREQVNAASRREALGVFDRLLSRVMVD